MMSDEHGRQTPQINLHLTPLSFIYLVAATFLIAIFWIVYPLENWVLVAIPVLWAAAIIHGKFTERRAL